MQQLRIIKQVSQLALLNSSWHTETPWYSSAIFNRSHLLPYPVPSQLPYQGRIVYETLLRLRSDQIIMGNFQTILSSYRNSPCVSFRSILSNYHTLSRLPYPIPPPITVPGARSTLRTAARPPSRTESGGPERGLSISSYRTPNDTVLHGVPDWTIDWLPTMVIQFPILHDLNDYWAKNSHSYKNVKLGDLNLHHHYTSLVHWNIIINDGTSGKKIIFYFSVFTHQ